MKRESEHGGKKPNVGAKPESTLAGGMVPQNRPMRPKVSKKTLGGRLGYKWIYHGTDSEAKKVPNQ